MGRSKNLIFWLLLIFVLSSFANMYHDTAKKVNSKELAFSDFLNDVENKNIKSVVIEGQNISGKMSDGKDFYTYSPYDPTMIEKLRASDVTIEAKPQTDSSGTFWGIVVSLLPVALLIGAWFYFMRQANSGNNKAMSFGRSKAKLVENKKKVTFADVARSLIRAKTVCKKGLYVRKRCFRQEGLARAKTVSSSSRAPAQFSI